MVKELKRRFKHYIETGDNSKIPADLQLAIFVAVSGILHFLRESDIMTPVKAVREGGREEYDAVIKLHDKPKTTTEKIAAM